MRQVRKQHILHGFRPGHLDGRPHNQVRERSRHMPRATMMIATAVKSARTKAPKRSKISRLNCMKYSRFMILGLQLRGNWTTKMDQIQTQGKLECYGLRKFVPLIMVI